MLQPCYNGSTMYEANGEFTKVIRARVRNEMKRWVNRYAKARRSDESSVVRIALSEFMQRNKESHEPEKSTIQPCEAGASVG